MLGSYCIYLVTRKKIYNETSLYFIGTGTVQVSVDGVSSY